MSPQMEREYEMKTLRASPVALGNTYFCIKAAAMAEPCLCRNHIQSLRSLTQV